MSIEERSAKIMINKAGGTASADAKNYRVALPSEWIYGLGIGEHNREVTLQFDGEAIFIRPAVPTQYEAFLSAAREKDHELLILYFYENEMLCTKICADKTTYQLCIQNQVADPLSTAFGVDQKPTWKDLQAFLESRCVPRQRDGLRYYLRQLGLDQYEPLEIIRRTQGRMAEDQHWIEILEG
jgi:hypothetical protein